MKSLKSWSLVGRDGRKKDVVGRAARDLDGLVLAVLRRTAAAPAPGLHLGPGLRDRAQRLATYLRAAIALDPFRFGGSYDRA